MQQDKVKLGYWNIRGLGERVRMLLEYVKLPYEQVVYTHEQSEKWFKQDKAALFKKNPAINLPYLIDGERTISESEGIQVYICHRSKRTDLLGRNADEQVSLATTQGIVRDLHAQYIELIYGKINGKTFQEAKPEYLEQFKPYLNKLNCLIEGKDYYCGEITYIDFGIAEFIQALWLLDSATIEAYPNVWNHQKRVWDLPQIKSYHESDRFKQRPINYAPYAAWV